MEKFHKLCLDMKTRILIILRLLIGHHDTSFDNENNSKNKEKRKLQVESARRKCRRILNHKVFPEDFIYDPLNIFSKPMGKINIRIMS